MFFQVNAFFYVYVITNFKACFKVMVCPKAEVSFMPSITKQKYHNNSVLHFPHGI